MLREEAAAHYEEPLVLCDEPAPLSGRSRRRCVRRRRRSGRSSGVLKGLVGLCPAKNVGDVWNSGGCGWKCHGRGRGCKGALGGCGLASVWF